jgi:hypothetical protein
MTKHPAWVTILPASSMKKRGKQGTTIEALDEARFNGQ